MTAPELLPCPFCGGPAELWQALDGRPAWVACLGRCSVLVTRDHTTTEDAIAAWNRRTHSPEVAALIAEARREGTKLLLDAYKGMLVLRRILYKAGLVEGGSAADQIAKRIVDAHPEFPGLASLRALKEETP